MKKEIFVLWKNAKAGGVNTINLVLEAFPTFKFISNVMEKTKNVFALKRGSFYFFHI